MGNQNDQELSPKEAHQADRLLREGMGQAEERLPEFKDPLNLPTGSCQSLKILKIQVGYGSEKDRPATQAEDGG